MESGVVSQEIDRYLTILGLAHKKHARSKTLSGGQKRKLSVGIALIGDSKVSVSLLYKVVNVVVLSTIQETLLHSI